MTDKAGIIEHDIEQRSPEWLACRVGKITGSTFSDIMPSKTDMKKGIFDKWTLAQEKVLYRIAAENLTWISGDGSFYVNDAMQWGIDHEEEARKAVESHMMLDSRECGIYQRGDFIASSPDAIMGDNEVTLELKCPASGTHFKYLKNPQSLYEDYKWQVLGEIFCTGLDSGIIASYDPRFQYEDTLIVYEVTDFADDMQCLIDRLDAFTEKIQELIQ